MFRNSRLRPAGLIAALIVLLAVSPAVFAGGSGEAGEEGPMVLTYAENTSDVDPITQGAKHFGELVFEYTDGRYAVEVLAGGQLGQPKATQLAVQTGTLEMARTNTFFMQEFGAEVMGLIGLPFIFQDSDHAWNVMKGPIGEEIIEEINGLDLGITVLGFYIAPPRSFFFTDAVVTSTSDMRGLNIRVPAGPLADAVTAFGGSATPVDFSELYSALQTGVVDGAEQPVKGFFNEGFYEISKNFTFTNHQVDPAPVFINTELWESMTAADQEAFKRAFSESQDFYRELEETERAQYMIELERDHGVTFYEVDDPNEWVSAVQHLYDEASVGYEDLLARIQAAAE